MFKKSLLVLSLLATSAFSATTEVAQDTATQAASIQPTKADYQKVVEQYKTYVASLPATLREEIKTFRLTMLKLNNEKRALYKALSIEAQGFLKKEQEFKRQLPVHQQKSLKSAAPDVHPVDPTQTPAK